MRDDGQGNSKFDFDLYERSEGELRKFKQRLPADSVEGLAREVIHRLAERGGAGVTGDASPDQITHLCFALISDDHMAGVVFINDARSAGASIKDVYLKYLAEAARMLGEWWDDDLVSFSEVTLGTARMYAIMRAMRHQTAVPVPKEAKSAIFLAVPGDNHTLGVRMATDLFRKEGWRIDLKTTNDHDQLVAEIAESPIPLVGISAAGRHSLDALTRLVLALRIEKPANAVFVSGQIVAEEAEAIALIGLDGVADDIESARALMTKLWDKIQNAARAEPD